MTASIRDFPTTPVTLVYESEQKVGIFQSLSVEASSNGPAYAFHTWCAGEDRFFQVASLDQCAADYWEAESWPGKVKMTVRPTVEDDVVNSITASFDAPLPIPVIAALVQDGITVQPVIYAMSEDDGYVATMMLSTGTGMYMRYAGEWHTLDPDVVDGLNATQVNGGAVDMFDSFDRAGQLVNISAMPTSEREMPRMQPVTPQTTPGTNQTPVTAGADLLLEVPVLARPEDAPAAIQAAMEHPELRWWVARRLKAMRIEADIPWEDA